MDNFVLSKCFNLANMTELGSLNPIFTYFYQLERQICKLEAAKSRAGVSNVFIGVRYIVN